MRSSGGCMAIPLHTRAFVTSKPTIGKTSKETWSVTVTACFVGLEKHFCRKSLDHLHSHHKAVSEAHELASLQMTPASRSVPKTPHLLADFQPAGLDYSQSEGRCPGRSVVWGCSTLRAVCSMHLPSLFAGRDADISSAAGGAVTCDRGI